MAVVAILMLPPGSDIAPLFGDRLDQARKIYNYKDKPEQNNQTFLTDSMHSSNDLLKSNNRTTRDAVENTTTTSPIAPPILEPKLATDMWDSLQERGCCGFKNATTEWGPQRLPKSCCCDPKEKNGEYYCEKVDSWHDRPCIEVIEARSFNLLLTLAMIALVNLYLASVSGISALRTFHYNEASQNAYS